MRLALVWLIAGCSFRIPAGSEVTGDDGMPVGDAPDDDGRVPPPPGPCGSPGVLADNFVDGSAASWWRVGNPGDVNELAGTLAVTPTSNTWSGYTAAATVDLRGAAAEVEVRSMVTGSGVIGGFLVAAPSGRAGFQVSDGMLTLIVDASTAQLPFDPVAHRLWRIAEAGGTVVLSTSPDGVTWTPRHTAPAPAWIAFSTVRLGGQNPGLVAAPGTVTFAQMSTLVAPATWCAVSTLSDGFNDSTIGPEWGAHGHSAGNCSEYETAGSARLDQAAGGPCVAFYGSSSLYSLADSAMVVRITSITNYVMGWSTFIATRDLQDRFVRLAFVQNQMCAEATGVPRTCAAYDQNEDLWRIREAAGMLYFETGQGPPPAAWRVVHSLPTPFDVARVRATFGTATDRNINTSINLSVDRLN